MTIIVQNEKRPSATLFAITSQSVPAPTRACIAVAYTTQSGCKLLFEQLAEKLGLKEWASTVKEITTSFDYGITEPGALEFLAKQNNCTVRIANVETLKKPGLRPRVAYHPKAYLFDRQVGGTGFVGSSNLTQLALTTNTEAGCQISDLSPSEVKEIWAFLNADAVTLTTALLDQYKIVRKKEKVVLPGPDSVPKRPIPAFAKIEVFPDAVTSGKLDPADFAHLWIEAGSMSSSASHNQLELPRYANRFFGFNFVDHKNKARIEIGTPPLTLGKTVWTDRKYTWHGDNQMERLYMPTQNGGGYDYENTAVLFRRHATGYEIEVAPWDSDLAQAWRNASAAISRFYRVGHTSKRVCGLF
jgi:HKD family nuclease